MLLSTESILAAISNLLTKISDVLGKKKKFLVSFHVCTYIYCKSESIFFAEYLMKGSEQFITKFI